MGMLAELNAALHGAGPPGKQQKRSAFGSREIALPMSLLLLSWCCISDAPDPLQYPDAAAHGDAGQ